MTWHEDIALEVAVEFRRLSTSHWDRIEDFMWRGRQIEHAAWAAFGDWWKKTTAGKRYFRNYNLVRIAAQKATIVAVRGCKACGKPFEVNAYRQERRRDRVCSTECRGASRQNIELVTLDGVAKPLSRWAEANGIALSTVWARIDRGWTVERALATPAVRRGASKEAA